MLSPHPFPHRPLPPLEAARRRALAALAAYDASPAVNAFTLAGQPAWLDAPTRATFSTSVQSALLLGEATLQLPLLGQVIPLPVGQAQLMLAQLQRYADAAAIATATHAAALAALTTVAEVVAYDFTAGYPEKLAFTL
jgi:hypothetical protein